MLRRDSSRSDPEERDELNPPREPHPPGSGSVDIQRELNRLEEMLIVEGFHIPFTGRTIVDEDVFLAQLDLVRANLPDAFEKAEKLILQREDILLQAEEYAQEVMDAAEQRADQLLDDLGIIQQAELEANQIRQRVQQECEMIQEQTRTEIERMRLQAQQELVQLRQLALEECEDIQSGADEYADAVLVSIEQQLTDMLRVIRNGRQQLHHNVQPGLSSETDAPGASGLRPPPNPPKK
ncbi:MULTISPECIES: ATP synthase F0 subunit B [unclassified Coleofasciculus]|uniref:ATP synthase F0 subunit B n=1 Tax=unclassified Coleofasciculus TaxID=2692782 RepID=UPI001D14682B|nr:MULTISPECIES: ATP synthase F0 subunit B [unclassified Coleofasciculus]